LTPPDPPRPFAEPWQAQAFALTLILHEKGLFAWPRWTAALANSLAAAEARGEMTDGAYYWDAWTQALEALTGDLGLADVASLSRRKAEWTQAYAMTPHGRPVELTAPREGSGAISNA
jgi:nitrile hydratase accessory protein